MTTARWFTTPVIRAAIAIACIPIMAQADDESAATPAISPAVAAADPKDVDAKPSVSATLPPAEPPPKQPPPAYSLPWQLRPLNVGNVVRSDTSIAFFDAKDMATGETDAGNTVSSMLLGMYKVTPKLAPMVRLAFVYNNEPVGAASAVVVNPLAGVLYATTIDRFKVAGFAAVTVPVGQGGGDSPDPADAKAASRGIPARSAMDNAMFATNYFAAIGGVGAGYVSDGFTAQLEVTLLQLIKTRGPEMQDDARTNFTAGVHSGYFLAKQLSIGGELRYQRWLTDAAPVVADPNARETVTFAIGPRMHFKLDGKQWLRPGISYSRVLDAPWSNNSYQIVQIDVPYVF
jgi:hypothetical protein